nr:hypothetical protein [Tanacetum cinerariifolium]
MEAVDVPQTLEYRGGQLNATLVLEVDNFTNWKKRGYKKQHEYLNDLKEEYQARALLAKSKRFFKKGTQRFSSAKETDQPECHKCDKKGHFARDCWPKTSDFEAKYHKVKAKLALLSSSASTPSSSSGKNKGLIGETCDWDDEEVSSDENEVTKVKALMALTDEERVSFGKESARNVKWTKISMKKVHTLLEIEDNDDRKSFLDYMCIDLNYVEEQRNNLLSKYRNLVQELKTCKEQLLVLKQVKLDPLTMQHVNTEILKENQNLRLELKELSSITETWLNNLVFIRSSADNSDMSITSSNIPKSFETEDSTLPNQDTDEVPSNELQRNTNDPSVVVSDSLGTHYDLADESSVCSTPILSLKKLDGAEPIYGPKTIKSILKSKSTFKAENLKADESSVCSTPILSLKKLDGAEPIYGPKTIKSILKSKSTFKAENLKGITINEPSSAPARGKSSSASKTNSAPIGKIISLRKRINPRNLQHVTKNCETCGSNVYSTSVHNNTEWFRKKEILQAKNAESFKASKNDPSSALRSKTPTKRQWFPTIGYGEEVSAKGTLRKSLLPPICRLLMAQIIQCLGGKIGGFDQIINKDAIILYSLANGINIDYANIFWEDIIIKIKKKQREKPGAQTRHNKPLTSLKQPSMSSKEATKGRSSKAPTGSKTGHSKKRKESSLAMDLNPSQPLVSTLVDTGMHKEDHEATGGPTSLRVTSEARAYPQLSSGISSFNLNESIYSSSFIIYSESASRNDALAVSIAEADPGNFASSDFVPQQQGMNEGTKNTSYDRLFAGKEASSIASQTEEETSSTIKLEDLAKLVSHVQPSFKDLDSTEDDPVIVVNDSDEDEDDEVHATENVETKDTLVPKSSSPRSSQVQELINQVPQDYDVYSATPCLSIHVIYASSCLYIRSLSVMLSRISFYVLIRQRGVTLSTHDFSSSLPTELKDLPSNFNDLTKEVKGLKNQVHNLEIELLGELKEIP